MEVLTNDRSNHSHALLIMIIMIWAIDFAMSKLLSVLFFLLVFKNIYQECGGEAVEQPNTQTIEFVTDDGKTINASLIPTKEGGAGGKDDDGNLRFGLCKTGAGCTSVRTDHSCEQIKTLWKSNKPLVALIHGFAESCQVSPICTTVRNAYLANFDWNVMTVDWSPLARPPNYADAVQGAITAGNVLSRLIHHFVQDCKLIDSKDVQIAGFSLGAHVGGHAGRNYQGISKSKIGRIVGLDPAGPLYTGRPIDNRLDPTDAEYVDVMHTNGCSQLCVGIEQPCGHADFFPNGGQVQPGCTLQIGCNHLRAMAYFEESVRRKESFRSCCYDQPQQYPPSNCPEGSANFMGQYSTAKGYCYLTTNSRSPYSKSGGRTGSGSSTALLKRPILTACFHSVVLSSFLIAQRVSVLCPCS